MTIRFPDLSHYRPGIDLAGQPALITKASEGAFNQDPTYDGYIGQADKLDIAGAGFHFLHGMIAISAQVANARTAIGAHPGMVDVEEAEDGTWPTMTETLDFIDAYRNAGGVLWLLYLPRWFWAKHWASAYLGPFADRGMVLIASDYADAYSDTGPGWAPYGGMAPAIWQYTDAQPLQGQAVDFNAFRGTAEQLRALFTGGTMSQPMGWHDDVVPNPPQRADSPGHVPPGTNPTTQYAFMLGDLWNLAIQQRDLLKSMDGHLAAIATGIAEAVHDLDELASSAAQTPPPAPAAAGDLEVTGTLHVGPSPAA